MEEHSHAGWAGCSVPLRLLQCWVSLEAAANATLILLSLQHYPSSFGSYSKYNRFYLLVSEFVSLGFSHPSFWWKTFFQSTDITHILNVISQQDLGACMPFQTELRGNQLNQDPAQKGWTSLQTLWAVMPLAAPYLHRGLGSGRQRVQIVPPPVV